MVHLLAQSQSRAPPAPRPLKSIGRNVCAAAPAEDTTTASWMRQADDATTAVNNKAHTNPTAASSAHSNRPPPPHPPHLLRHRSSRMAGTPSVAAVAGLLRQAVYYHLDNGNFPNAAFFAERLVAHDARSPESAYLVALCHLRLGDNRSAYEASKLARNSHLGCAFVFAQACLVLERHKDGINALEKTRVLWTSKPATLGKHSATTRSPYPDAAAVACLLGKLYRAYRDRKNAIDCFEEAVNSNPFMWDAFTALCDLGVPIRVPLTFRYKDTLLQSFDFEPLQQPRDEGQSKKAAGLRGGNGVGQTAWLDNSTGADPFHAGPVGGSGAGGGGLFSGDNAEENNNFLAKIAAARERLAYGDVTRNTVNTSGRDGMETPTGHASGTESTSSRARGPSEPPPPPVPSQAPQVPATRRTRGGTTTAHGADVGLTESTQQQPPPKMSYRLTSKRPQRPQPEADAVAVDGSLAGGSGSSTGTGLVRPSSTASSSVSSAATGVMSSSTDRKRTVSGHPVSQQRQMAAMGSSGEETGVQQRRSARLNMFKPSSSARANNNSSAGTGTTVNHASGAATIGAGASRELKRTRPPISRIMRPGSAGGGVGAMGGGSAAPSGIRVVSGNRKLPTAVAAAAALDDGGMDVDHAEAPRVVVKEVVSAVTSQQQQPQQHSQHHHHHHHHQSSHLQPQAQAAPPVQKPPPEPEWMKMEESIRWVLELLKTLGAGYTALSQYKCKEALETNSLLPRPHQDTPWVLALMGRAHYEMTNYAEADKFFRRLRAVAPTRMEDMEVYSTILWFLKRETDLSFLAHELVDADWHSPQAWCALGNAWSLAREHEQALKCFKRATQLNPKFAYAFTLQGHEHVANEEYDKALQAYRMAVSADKRHYNAFYGIGRVYEKLGSYDKAQVHYRSASSINPTNAVLVCCIGTVLEKQKRIMQALKYYTLATDLAPRAAQTRYKKARALLATNRLEEAKAELMILKDLAPDEATVHFLLGRLHKTLGEKGLAVRHYTIALNLDPKASQQIKEAIEGLEDEEGIDDSMMA